MKINSNLFTHNIYSIYFVYLVRVHLSLADSEKIYQKSGCFIFE